MENAQNFISHWMWAWTQVFLSGQGQGVVFPIVELLTEPCHDGVTGIRGYWYARGSPVEAAGWGNGGRHPLAGPSGGLWTLYFLHMSPSEKHREAPCSTTVLIRHQVCLTTGMLTSAMFTYTFPLGFSCKPRCPFLFSLSFYHSIFGLATRPGPGSHSRWAWPQPHRTYFCSSFIFSNPGRYLKSGVWRVFLLRGERLR